MPAILLAFSMALQTAMEARAAFVIYGPNVATQEMSSAHNGAADKNHLFLMRSSFDERIEAQVQIPDLSLKIARLENPDTIRENIEHSFMPTQKKVLVEQAFAVSRLHILATLLYRRGTLLAVLGENSKAMQDLGAALASDQNYAPAYNNRACLKASVGDYDGALADANQALLLAPNFVEAYDTRGSVYLAQKDYNRAGLDFDKAISAKPDYAEAFYHRSLLKRAQGKDGESVQDLEKAKTLGYQEI
jgi:tetratricopeptide (TPR) repeat protein